MPKPLTAVRTPHTHVDLLLGLVALKALLQRAVGFIRLARVPPKLRQRA